MNEALVSDTTYITCMVNDGRKPYQFGPRVGPMTCERDFSGPQDLKACVDGDVCYLYKWKQYGTLNMFVPFKQEHNDKPLGIGEWNVEPYYTNATDIITSSVRSAHDGLDSFRLKKDGSPVLLTEKDKSSFMDIAKTSTPGAFMVPVCYSDYNWNTRLSPARPRGWFELPFAANNPYCHEHTLPCYCGPWGKQTTAVWESIGLKGSYSQKMRCAKKIKKVIKNPMELFIAQCRIGVSFNKGWFWRNVDKILYRHLRHHNCDKVIGVLENFEYHTFEEIPSTVRWILYCKILGPDLNEKAKCNAYKPLWEEITAPGAGKPKNNNGDQIVAAEVKVFESEFARLALEDSGHDDE